MNKDYRNTKYCPVLTDLVEKKKAVKKQVLSDHPKATDLHAYISDNNGPYKNSFMRAYNGKCAYCGVSIDVISRQSFEIDHFIHQKSSRFNGSKAAAGYIENLVLAWHNCNHKKLDMAVPDEMFVFLHPDSDYITKSFVRDEQYYIRVSTEMKDNTVVQQFYEKLNLGAQIHRIDYLLMSMKGLNARMADKPGVTGKLSKAIELLQTRRNLMG